MDQRAPLSHRRDKPQERQIVHINSGKRQGVKFILCCLEFGTLQFNINQTSLPIISKIFLAEFKLKTHFRQCRQFNFQEFNRRTTNSNFRIRHRSRCNKAHRFNRIFARIIVQIFTNSFTTRDFQGCRTNSLNFHAQLFQEETNILDHVIWASITNDGSIW